MQLPTAGLIVIKENRILLAFSKNKEAWYLPGGKIDAGETPAQGLVREIKEELSIVINPQLLHFYCHVTAPAYGEEQYTMEQECFLYPLKERAVANSEIAAIRYFSFEEYLRESVQVCGVIEVFENLKRDQLL